MLSAKIKGLHMGNLFVCLLFLVVIGAFNTAKSQEPGKTYVGSEACKDCHETEYQNFQKYAKKSSSFQSVAVMKEGLEKEDLNRCFTCHTTGYGKPGGFKSETETPQLKNAGCEACHGPGSIHAETGDPGEIKGRLSSKDCEDCHSSERVESFQYKPLIYGGAH